MKCNFLGVNIREDLETLDASSSIGYLSLLSFFVVFLVLVANIAITRDYNTVGMILKCSVAGFHLFVYSFSSIILNKTSPGDLPSQLGRDCAMRQPPHRLHIFASE